MASSALDRCIAQSKQITEDLITVRRELKTVISSHRLEDARYRTASRLRIVLDSWQILYDQINDLWQDAAGLKENKTARMERMRAALDDGQLKLISGERK